MNIFRYVLSSFLTVIPSLAAATEGVSPSQTQQSVRYTGVSAVWILANISYAGMRAQKNPNRGWRILSFLFGFPGTLLTYFVVPEGGERAYGIDIPKKREDAQPVAPHEPPPRSSVSDARD